MIWQGSRCQTVWKAQADMADPVQMDIGQELDVKLFSSGSDAQTHILAFHGGGGVAGTPDMMAPFAERVSAGGDISMILARYRTLNADQATFEDMRADAAHALGWACENLADGVQLYLLGASFGGLLVLDALLEAPAHIQDKVAGLILLNPVTDIGPDGWNNRVVNAQDHGHLCPTQRLAQHPLLARLRCYMAHGGQDDVVPLQASRRFAAIWPVGRCTLMEFPNSVHGFFNRAPHNQTVAEGITSFVAQVPKPAATPPKVKGKARRFKAAHLLPKGLTTVYGIGAQKAGTSWLFDCLSESPECLTGPTKEQHYFDALFVKSERSHLDQRLAQLRKTVERVKDGVDARNLKHLSNINLLADRLSIHAAAPGDHRPYVDYLCRGHRDEKIVCDFTPSYCTLDAAGFQAMNSIGPAKFIYVLRDPVDRMWSQVRMSVSASNPKLEDEAYEAKCLEHVRNQLNERDLSKIPRADYARTMAALETAVPHQNIHYAFYETLFAQGSVDQICAFVGIKPVKVSAEQRVNQGRSSSLPQDVAQEMAQALAPQYHAVEGKFGDAVPDSWQQGVTAPAPGPIDNISEKVVRLGHRLRGR